MTDALERARRGTNPPAATMPQRRRIHRLARLAGMEVPQVAWRHQAADAIDRLERHVREPMLELFG